MSFPTVPNVNPMININQEQVTNLLLASIAFEELGLAHLINAEAEKVQFVLGTLDGTHHCWQASLNDLLNINKSVRQTLQSIIKKEMLLQFKLEDILESLVDGTPKHHKSKSYKDDNISYESPYRRFANLDESFRSL